MKVIKPTLLTDSLLTSSTVSEDDFPQWNAATNYTIGGHVIRLATHRIYKNLLGGIDSTPPEEALVGPTPKWVDVGPTNRWAMFDDEVGSLTVAENTLTYVLTPGQIEGISFLEIFAETLHVVLRESPGGTVVYDQTFVLDGSIVDSVFSWFFEPYSVVSELSIVNLPAGYYNPEITITLAGSGQISCGVCKFGTITDIGGTEYGAKLGIISYSRKETNEFGRVVVVPRRYVKTLEAKIHSDSAELRRIYRALGELKDTPCVWIGSDAKGYESLTVFGFYKDFSIDVTYPTLNYCTLQIEGLI